MTSINRFWGIVSYGWVPVASLVVSAAILLLVGTFWYTMGSRSKKTILGFQIVLQLLYAVGIVLTILCYVYRSQIDVEVSMLSSRLQLPLVAFVS